MESRTKVKEKILLLSKLFGFQTTLQKLILVIAIVCVAAIVGIIIATNVEKNNRRAAEVRTVSTLEKIIDVSELSTFTSVYNGIAEVKNEKEPEKIDYYVAYESKVNAGIDFKKVVISCDSEQKTIVVKIPEIYINDIIVDITSMEFLFLNEKANTTAVTEQAFKACELDVLTESADQQAIYELAKQNARNILTALTKPIVEQMDSEYTLVVE